MWECECQSIFRRSPAWTFRWSERGWGLLWSWFREWTGIFCSLTVQQEEHHSLTLHRQWSDLWHQTCLHRNLDTSWLFQLCPNPDPFTAHKVHQGCQQSLLWAQWCVYNWAYRETNLDIVSIGHHLASNLLHMSPIQGSFWYCVCQKCARQGNHDLTLKSWTSKPLTFSLEVAAFFPCIVESRSWVWWPRTPNWQSVSFAIKVILDWSSSNAYSRNLWLGSSLWDTIQERLENLFYLCLNHLLGSLSNHLVLAAQNRC